ncbi:hypothetical protein SF23_18410 [Streptomyces sp. MBRL 10]|nr:hypothetical protein SF23_18410 [Streptomyces sp. MBRL 10]
MEFVEGDRADVAGVGDHVPVVVGASEEAAYAVAARQEGGGGRGERGGVRDEEGGGLGEAVLGGLQFVVRLEGLRDDLPRGGVLGGGRADARDEARASGSWPYSQRFAAWSA